jgi:hypothetical protein
VSTVRKSQQHRRRLGRTHARSVRSVEGLGRDPPGAGCSRPSLVRHSSRARPARRGCGDAPKSGSPVRAEPPACESARPPVADRRRHPEPSYVHRPATSSRCRRSNVPGPTIRHRHSWRGGRRDNAANSSRSAGSNRGRPIWRRSTAVSCRSTSSSTSLIAGHDHAGQRDPAASALPRTRPTETPKRSCRTPRALPN